MDGQITELRVQGRREPRVAVALDGEPWATLDAETVVRLGLRRGMRLDDAARTAALAADAAVRARKVAARHCAAAPKTWLELERLLAARGFDEHASETALTELLASGTLDDQRVAGRIVKARRHRRDTGPARVHAELTGRGIEELEAERRVEAAFAQVDLPAECLALALRLRPRFEPLAEPRNQARLAGALARRGYDPEIVTETIERLPKD